MAGTRKALLHNLHPFIAILLGAITRVGGGIIRDIFLVQISNVLRADVYPPPPSPALPSWSPP